MIPLQTRMEENCNFCPFDSCGLLQTCPSNLQLMHRRAMESEKLPSSVQRARWVAGCCCLVLLEKSQATGDVRKEAVVAEVLSGEPQPAERWRPPGEAGAACGCPLARRGGPQVTRSSSSLQFPQCVLSGMKTTVEDSLLSHLRGSVVWPARKGQSTQRYWFSLVENAKASEKYKSILTTNVTKSWLAPFSSELNAEIREAASKVIFRQPVVENTTYCAASFGGKVWRTAIKWSSTNYLQGISLKIHCMIKWT